MSIDLRKTVKTMDRKEAAKALSNGKILTHTYFQPNEWVKSIDNGRYYTFEDGCICSPDEFWHFRKSSIFDNGWTIYDTKPKNESLGIFKELDKVVNDFM